jgi:hypothetical protein
MKYMVPSAARDPPIPAGAQLRIDVIVVLAKPV